MAADPEQGTPSLSLRNGCRCVPEPGVTVEELLLIFGEQVGFENILSASRMNKAVVVFLKSESLVNQLIVSGIWVKETFVRVNPLSTPATKITISNVPPFISDEMITKELQRFGKIAGPVRTIPLGCKNVALKHVLSFRRQVYMFLNSPDRTLDASFRVNHGDNSYMVFASTESMKCFQCGVFGHKRFFCPNKDEKQTTDTNTGTNDTEIQTGDKQTQGGGEQREEEQQEVSETSVIVSSVEQPGCSNPAESVDVSEAAENNDTTDCMAEECEISQAESVGDSMIDELDGLSQCMDDSIRDEEQWSDAAAENDNGLYTVEQINSFLDKTKGKVGVEVSDYFPDTEKFISSVMRARKVSSLEVLSQQKRFRLRKHITNIRSGKKPGKVRGKTKY